MNSKTVIIAFVLALAILIGIAGLRGMKFSSPPLEIFSDMMRQNKTHPQTLMSLPDGRKLAPISGTIPFNRVEEKDSFNSGLITGTTNYVELIPLAVDKKLILRGKERYEIFCSHCHGVWGDGNTVARRTGAMPIVANLHEKRIEKMADGEIFNVVTHGRNLMSSHSAIIPASDRWAIIAYVRTLQLSRLGTISDVPEPERERLINTATN